MDLVEVISYRPFQRIFFLTIYLLLLAQNKSIWSKMNAQAAVLSKYVREKMGRGVDLLEEDVSSKLYDIDMNVVGERIYEIWSKFSDETIRNIWRKTRLV